MIRIDELPVAGTLTGAELLELVQDDVSVQGTIADIVQLPQELIDLTGSPFTLNEDVVGDFVLVDQDGTLAAFGPDEGVYIDLHVDADVTINIVPDVSVLINGANDPVDFTGPYKAASLICVGSDSWVFIKGGSGGGGSLASVELNDGTVTGVDGAIAQGYADGGFIAANYPGGFAQGYTYYSNITANDYGAFAQGSAVYGQPYDTFYGYGITATAGGAFAHGYAEGGTITSRGYGSHAGGYAYYATIDAGGRGGFAHGYSYYYDEWELGGDALIYADDGCFAHGYSYGGAIIAWENGAFAGGYAYHHGTIYASGYGSFAHGYATYGDVDNPSVVEGSYQSNYATGIGQILATGAGSFATGYAYGGGGGGYTNSGNIRASGYGAFAVGRAYYNDTDIGNIQAFGAGSFAQGYAYGGNIIADTWNGTFAQGYACNYNIHAGGYGAVAHGCADTAAIEALAQNTVQFGPGTNNLADSVKIGLAGLQFLGVAGPPGAPAVGMFWIESGDVWVQTAAGPKALSGLP